MTSINARLRASIAALLAGGLLLGAVATAQGHATVQLYGGSPKADGYGAMWLRIAHGCEDAKGNPLATTRVVVVLPGDQAWQSARPQQVGGWKARRQIMKSGEIRLSWRATAGHALADAEFQDFGVSVKYPKAAGTYGIPTTQYCGKVRLAWTETPGAGVAHPYPTVTVAAASGSGHH
jgi:uncharacterized protein YcnI